MMLRISHSEAELKVAPVLDFPRAALWLEQQKVLEPEVELTPG